MKYPKLCFFSQLVLFSKQTNNKMSLKLRLRNQKREKTQMETHHISHNKTDGIFIYFLYFVNDFIKQFNWSDSIIVSKYHNMWPSQAIQHCSIAAAIVDFN